MNNLVRIIYGLFSTIKSALFEFWREFEVVYRLPQK